MSGRRHVMDSAGDSYEDCAAHLMGRIASMIRVPGKKDFGVDFYFQPRVPFTKQTETVTELGSIQVKGGSEELSFGGLNEKGQWREYEFIWLKSQAAPLYLARVDAKQTSVELFSIWPMWLVFWPQTQNPFEVVFTTAPAGDESFVWQKPQPAPDERGKGHGDGHRWTVHVGPPFLRLTNNALNDPAFRLQAVAILRTWIAYDRLTMIRYQQFIPWLRGIIAWRTNSPDILQAVDWQFWGREPGANIARLCQTAAPMLVSLGTHLQWQDDRAAYDLLPVLRWINNQGLLDPMGQGLIENLERAQAKGGSPADDPSVARDQQVADSAMP